MEYFGQSLQNVCDARYHVQTAGGVKVIWPKMSMSSVAEPAHGVKYPKTARSLALMFMVSVAWRRGHVVFPPRRHEAGEQNVHARGQPAIGVHNVVSGRGGSRDHPEH